MDNINNLWPSLFIVKQLITSDMSIKQIETY